MDNYFTKKEQIVILVLALGIVSLMGFKFLNNPDDKLDIGKEEIKEPIIADNNIEETPLDQSSKDIMVHISGQVYNPGIIQLQEGDRLIDGVELAGGLKKEADLDKINLAKRLNDEDKVYIPKIGEDIEIETATIISRESTNNSPGKIDINSCSKEDLMALPGIGEVTSNKILDHRSNTAFKKIEDIMQVSGIGEKKFDGIRELIIVR